MKDQISRKRTTRLAALLAITIGTPAATLALPTDALNSDDNTPRRADASSASSIWDEPAAPSPVQVVRPTEAAPAMLARTLSANPLWEIPFARLSATRERPIFSPSRRPPPPAVVSVPVATEPPPPKPPRVDRPQLSLVGTIAGEEESFGIFVDQTTKAAVRLKIGEDYQGWRLRAVQGREVTLEHDRQTAILALPQPGAGAVVPAQAQVENIAPWPMNLLPQRQQSR